MSTCWTIGEKGPRRSFGVLLCSADKLARFAFGSMIERFLVRHRAVLLGFFTHSLFPDYAAQVCKRMDVIVDFGAQVRP